MNVACAFDDADSAPGLGRRVLLVDDDAIQLKLVKTQLEVAGFVVDAAKGARAAEEMLRRGAPPAAIVSDVVMDDVDGFTLCANLRRDPAFSAIPIVLLSSAFDEPEDRSLAHRLGASALVERSPNQHACVEALVKTLAEPPPSAPRASAVPDVQGRMLHQLMRLSERRACAETRYELLFEHAHDAISLLTPDGVVIDANRKWEQISGRPRESLRGLRVSDFEAPGHEESNEDLYASLVRGGTERTPPVAIRAGDGSTVFLEFTATTVDIDGTPTVLAIGRDVTSLVEATRRLEASERHYRSLVENVPDVLWSATHDWTYTYFSPNVEKLSGYSAEELLEGKHGESLGRVHPDDIERIRAAREAVMTNGTPMDIEYRWQHRDGRWLWMHLRGVKTSAGIDGMFSDITARKALEDQLFQSQKVEALGQLTAGVAHDFNNILGVILMNASELVDTLPQTDMPWELARDIEDAGKRGTELTRQLLSFSRRQPSTPKAIDLNALLSGMRRMLARSAGSAIDLVLPQDEHVEPTYGDAGQLMQVVMNLVVNARDAMPNGGTIRIETANVHLDAAESAARGLVPGPYVCLSVADTGCGMDAETQNKVFEPFFTTKTSDAGTGLGLATCYGIVRHARGCIVLESDVGRGTTFRVYLPAVRSSEFTTEDRIHHHQET